MEHYLCLVLSLAALRAAGCRSTPTHVDTGPMLTSNKAAARCPSKKTFASS